MEARSREFIELVCLKLAHMQPGCGDLLVVRIGPVERTESGPNWEVSRFVPDLDPLARDGAMRALDVLREIYALERYKELTLSRGAPFVRVSSPAATDRCGKHYDGGRGIH